MNVLVTGAASRLAQAIATELADDHKVRLVDSATLDLDTSAEVIHADILDQGDAWTVVRGVDAVIHTAQTPPGVPEEGLAHEQEVLDFKTRGTHNIMQAAVDASAKRMVYASTLLPLQSYPDDVYVTESWKPMPSTDMDELATYLGELTTREFARDHLVTVTALRLGVVVTEDEVAGEPPNLMWVELRDAARAFRCALEREASQRPQWQERYAVYHIAANLPNPKFLINGAVNGIGYRPEHDFRDHFPAA